MKATEKHYQFWVERKAAVSWFSSDKPKVSIHELIPLGGRFDNCTHNTLHLVAMALRNKKDLKAKLLDLAKDPGTRVRPEKRASLARKWLQKLGVDIDKEECYGYRHL